MPYNIHQKKKERNNDRNVFNDIKLFISFSTNCFQNELLIPFFNNNLKLVFFISFVGFYGKTNLDMARVDYICDSLYDLFNDFMRMFYDKEGKMVVGR